MTFREKLQSVLQSEKDRAWLEVYDRQRRLGTPPGAASDIADRVVGPLRNAIGLGWAEEFTTAGGFVGLGSFLKKVVKVAAPIAMSVMTGGVGGVALAAGKGAAMKAIAGAALKKTVGQKLKEAVVTRVLPGVGKIAKGAARIGRQASKVAAVAGTVGAGAGAGVAIGNKVIGRGGESLDVTFLDEEGMIVKTRGRRRSGRRKVTRRSRRSSPIRRRSSTRRPAPKRRASPRRRTTRRRASPAQRRARSKFLKRYAKKGRRRR